MRITRARLVFLALAALDDIVQGCATAPAAPSAQFRAVLAMLCALGVGEERRDDRKLFDAIWRSSQIKPSHTLTEHQANHRRMTELGRMWPEVCRHVGVEPTTELSLRLEAMRRRGETDREAMARIMREQGEAERVWKAHRRQKQQCSAA